MSTIKQQLVKELHRPTRRVFPRRPVILKSIDDLWQADLVELIPYARDNKGCRYILAVIDCFSKYAWAVSVKRKTAEDVTEAFKKMLTNCKGRTARNLQTDHGKEFYNRKFQKLMKEHKINHYSTYTNMKASIVERFNRTLKQMMWKQFSLQGTYKWIGLLPSLIKTYNNSKHRTIAMKPSEVNHRNEDVIIQVYDVLRKNKKKAKYRVGDKVRVSKHKTEFRKGYLPNWSTEVFTIHETKKTVPHTYILRDMNGQIIAGGFYEEELQVVKYPEAYLVEKILKRRGNRVLVKWLGLDDSHNSWEKAENINI